MTTATVRDLRLRFPHLESLLLEGETVLITKGKKPVAQLIPAPSPKKPNFKKRFGGAVSRAKKTHHLSKMVLEERQSYER